MIDFLYDIIQTVFLATLGYRFYLYFFMQENDDFLSVIVFVTISILVIAFKHLQFRQRMLLVGILAILLAGGYSILRKIEMLSYVTDNISLKYALVLSLVLTVFVDLLMRFSHSKTVVLFVILIMFAAFVYKNIQIRSIDGALGYFCILISVLQIIQSNWKKKGDTDIRKHTVYVSPFILIVFVVLTVVKTPAKPYDWRAFKNIFFNVCEFANMVNEKMFHENRDDFASAIGFGEDGRISGNIKDSEKNIFSITTTENPGRVIYLKGKSFDTFDGRKWDKTDKSDNLEMGTNSYFIKAAVKEQENGSITDYLREETLKIDFFAYSTKYVFAPTSVIALSDKGRIAPENVGGDLFFDESKGYGDSYSVRYYKYNLDSDKFADMTEEARKFAKNSKVRDELYSKLLKAYRSNAKEYYLMQGRETSDTVKEITEAIVSKEKGTYRKLKALEKYLNGIEYSTTCEGIPKDVTNSSEFLDYFLLDVKEGSCSYYATAFVLLARSIGVPARYVEGFYIKAPKEGTGKVKSSWAHAWAECYIDGAGWITFDPTPGYNVSYYWKTSDDYATDESQEKLQDETDASSWDDEDSQTDDPEENNILVDVPKYFFVLPVVLCLFFVIVFIAFDIVLRLKKLEKLTGKRKIAGYCKWNLNLLKIAGEGIADNRTLLEYKKSIEENEMSEYSRFCGFITCYEKLLYSDEEISEIDERTVLDDNLGIRNQLKLSERIKYYLFFLKSLPKVSGE